MDFCFFVPVIFGCTNKISPEGDQTPRICPRCHNGAVCSAKSKEYFEVCFVPLIPMSSKHIWLCSICQWQVSIQAGGWEPPLVTSVPTQPGGYYPSQPGPQPGYQPGYQSNYPPQNYQPSPGHQAQGQYQQNPAQYQQNPVQYQPQGPPPVQYGK